MNSFCQALLSPKYHLPCQDALCQWSLKLESMKTGGHPDRSWDIQDSQIHGMKNFCLTLIFPKCHLPCQEAPCPRSLELESLRTKRHPDRSWDVRDTQLYGINIFWQTLISPKCHLPCQDASCPQSQGLESMRIFLGLPERIQDVQDTILGDLTHFLKENQLPLFQEIWPWLTNS
jgi:hypothetical protein